MPEILKPGSHFVFMKVGTHALEPLEEIIARKRKEISDEGFALWGYGGNTCHPLRMVQPFARDYVELGETLYLIMQPMNSKHFAVTERADEYSPDGVNWSPVPRGINVIGSRYAMAIDDLRTEEFDLALADTRVASGMSAGRRGDRYIAGHVDKGCLEFVEADESAATSSTKVRIGLIARLVEPYAVLVR
jgi:hypothetical protein